MRPYVLKRAFSFALRIHSRIRPYHFSCSDETPLIRDEFLHEAPIGPHDLGAEPILGVAIDEHDSWSPSVPKEIVKSLKDKQVRNEDEEY